jgi:hypothetical protein
MPSSTTLFSNSRNVHRARPLGGLEHAKAISLASFLAIENARHSRRDALLAAQDRFEALFHQLLAHAIDHARTGSQGGNDLAVTPDLAGIRDNGLQQDSALQQTPCRQRWVSDDEGEVIERGMTIPVHRIGGSMRATDLVTACSSLSA